VHTDDDRVGTLQILGETKSGIKAAREQGERRAARNGIEKEALPIVERPRVMGELREFDGPHIVGEPSQEASQLLGN
jgi:hypothetical protein